MKASILTRLMTAVVLICTIHPVSAQQTESVSEKAERLAAFADANRQNWQAQYDAGMCYLDTLFSASEYMEAETYLRRALDIAQAQVVKRDTILGKTLMAIGNLSSGRNRPKDMLEYHGKALQAYVEELGPSDAVIPPLVACLASETFALYMRGESGADITDAIKLFRLALQLYSQLPDEQQAGGKEDVETAYSYALEILLVEEKNLSKDKVWQWTDVNDNGKKYDVLAFDDWTLENTSGLLATILYNVQNNIPASDRKRGMILIDEQGNVEERIHAQIDFNMKYGIEGNNYVFNQDNTLRLTRVTPERRKELIDALHTFEQKQQTSPLQ